MRVERVCVVGAGVIGSLYAAHLAQVAEVSVLTRRDEHARSLREEGLHVSGRHEFTSRLVAASTDPAELPEPEVVIVATKATDLEPAAARLEGRFPDAVVMTVQNGLGAEEVIRRYGGWPLVSGVTFMSGTRHADMHVEYVLNTETWLGPYEATPFETAQAIAELLVRSGLKAEAMPDLRPAQWSKLIFNATVNGLAALTGLPHDFHFAAEDEPFDLGHLVHGRRAPPPSSRPASSGSWRRRRCTRRPRLPRQRMPSRTAAASRPSRTASATRRRSRGTSSA